MVSKEKDLRYLLTGLVLIIIINILAPYFPFRIDLTAEKRYTLSPISKEILRKMDQTVKVTVYLEGDFPAGFRRLRNASEDLLQDLKSLSNSRVVYEFTDPTEGKMEQEQQQYFAELYQKGLEPTNLTVKTEDGLSQKIIFPAALVSCNGKEIPVPLLQNRMGLSPDEVLNNSVQNLEYSFISAIRKVLSDGKPRVAFTEGHGELSDEQLQSAMQILGRGYEVGRLDLKRVTMAGLEKLDILVIPKPATAFTELEKFKIDQFLMKGGKIFWAIDQVNAELDSMQNGAAEQMAFDKKLNLDDQLFKYGVRINYDLVGDMNCRQIPLNVGNVGGQGQLQMVPWLFYPIIMPISQNPIVKNINGIKTEFINTIDTIATRGIKKEVLLQTSPFNRILEAPTIISLNMVEDIPDPQKFQSPPKTVCVLLEGRFPSVFKNRAIPEGLPQMPRQELSKPAAMVVLSDGDILKNEVGKDGSVFPLGDDRFTGQTFGNATFLQNVIDYLSGEERLIQLRAKEIKLRLLDKGKLKEQKFFWQTINILFPLIFIIVSGIFQHIYRKRKYAA